MITTTQEKIKRYLSESIMQKLEQVGLTVIDKDDLQITIDTYTKHATENRELRARIAKLEKGIRK